MIVVKNALLYGEKRANVLIKNGTIARIGQPDDTFWDKGCDLESAQIIDGTGLIMLPGLVDLHAHLREPGDTGSESVRTATMAAAAGGFTHIFAMPNTNPPIDSVHMAEYVHFLGLDAGFCRVTPIGCVTIGQEGCELAPMASMHASRAGVSVFSDDGKCVMDARIMYQALEYARGLGVVVAQHAEDTTLSENASIHSSDLSLSLGMKGWIPEAESSIIARDVLLARAANARLHICHVSSWQSVEIIRRAKEEGVQVTAEVTPHHLFFTQDVVKDALMGEDLCGSLGWNESSTVYKVNPPIREMRDVEALCAGLRDGTIDIIATDHAPHARDRKHLPFEQAAYGMTGLECALSVVHAVMLEQGDVNWRQIAKWMSARPKQIAGVKHPHAQSASEPQNTQPTQPTPEPLAEGMPADIVLYDPNRTWTPGGDLYSRGVNCPYIGRRLPGRVVHTIFGGKFTYFNCKIVEVCRG